MINNENNQYWKIFYLKNEKDLLKPSLFAKFVLSKLKDGSSLVDIACGNGRDSMFFEENGIKTFSLYNCNIPFFLGKNFIKADALTFTLKADAYYSRFFFHTIIENQLVEFLSNISKNMTK